ncbi:hypothetical protein M514_04621 [Trichuris suis]|uniref:Uncharacterized protein n=1 Tax=Trichuris suis TaxID=68888 RepID=A0A085NV43_9BILA|nr:hypothetical protein M513_04621 [Trichuris suis]KFD73339.1 hypothetical protein M514_04621 [Trichuris suis]
MKGSNATGTQQNASLCSPEHSRRQSHNEIVKSGVQGGENVNGVVEESVVNFVLCMQRQQPHGATSDLQSHYHQSDPSQRLPDSNLFAVFDVE